MQINREQIEPTKVKLTIVAEESELDTVKQHVIRDLSKNVKIPGFRPGKAPANLIEKQIDPSAMQAEFVDHAVNDLYGEAISQSGLRPVAQPEIAVTKFVPYSTLEFTVEVEAIGDVKLADYKNIKLAPKSVEVTTAEVTKVINDLRERAAAKTEVDRAAKTGDEVVFDFTGVDAKSKDPIDGTDAKDYPLVIGSGNFIPGFEDELIGLKPKDKKDFDITFPKDYGVADLQNRKVTFSVNVRKVQELVEPKADDEFAQTVGPFSTLAELKTDIKKQVTVEKQQEANRAYDNELLEKIANQSTVNLPKSLIEDEIDRMEEEEKRNIVYRGQTWQEHLDAEKLTAEEHREKQRTGATLRVKGGLILGEISQAEGISVTPDEVDLRLKLLKGQYTDVVMQAELDKPESRRDITSRILTEKTLDKLRSYASK
jgi:trigger factor